MSEITLTIRCVECKAEVTATIIGSDWRGQAEIHVSRCEKCLQEARDAGYKEGHDDGYELGISDNAE